jgi:hypothetical protein
MIMAWLGWLRPRPSAVVAQPTQPLWSPGPVRVAVVGETYHAAAVARARQAARTGVELIGVLAPEPTNRYDRNAVAVYVLGELVGHVPREVAGVLQRALLSRLVPYAGQLAGRAEVNASGYGPEIAVLVDPAPIGIRADQLDVLPAMAAEVRGLLSQVVTPASGGGVELAARAELVEAERHREQVDLDYDRPAGAWRILERQFQDLAARLDDAGDSAAGAAWLGAARSIRYQKGRRSDTLSAYTEALRRDPSQVAGWCELLDYLAWAPDVGTLMAVLQSAPAEVRPELIPTLLLISRGTDRGGRMSPDAGERLRADMLATSEQTADLGCLAALYADAGRQAAKAKDDEAVHDWWRRAVAAGCTDPQVVDRVSTRLVQDNDFQAAAATLRLSLARDDVARTVRERMEKRLARCERELSRSIPEGAS